MSQPGWGGVGGKAGRSWRYNRRSTKRKFHKHIKPFIKERQKIKSSFCPVISNATFAHLSHFGFQIEVTKNRWDNARQIIQNTKQNECDNQPSTMTYHDLRPSHLIAESHLQFGKLLGLGLKFCLQEERPKESVLDKCMLRF